MDNTIKIKMNPQQFSHQGFNSMTCHSIDSVVYSTGGPPILNIQIFTKNIN